MLIGMNIDRHYGQDARFLIGMMANSHLFIISDSLILDGWTDRKTTNSFYIKSGVDFMTEKFIVLFLNFFICPSLNETFKETIES